LELDVPEVNRMSGPQEAFPTGEVRVQAARILASDVMRRAEKLRDLLQYFVEERIARGDRPASQKQIATIVLGATADFNPTSNAHVRTYVRRLRKLLAKYYAGPGASDPLILGVPAGTYRLSVEQRAAAGQSDAPAVKSGRRSARARSIVLLTESRRSGSRASSGSWQTRCRDTSCSTCSEKTASWPSARSRGRPARPAMPVRARGC